MLIFLISIIAGLVALSFAGILTFYVLKQDEGNDKVKFIGKAIQEGAMAFLGKVGPEKAF